MMAMEGALPLALTMGEPAGIGGEITLKAWLGRTPAPIFFAIDDPEPSEPEHGDRAEGGDELKQRSKCRPVTSHRDRVVVDPDCRFAEAPPDAPPVHTP